MENLNTDLHYEVNLDNCAREPIHIIGNTQEFGLLLVVDPETFKIVQTGCNSSGFLSVEPEELLGKELASIFGEALVNDYRSALEEQLSLPPQVQQLGKQQFLLLARLSNGHLLLDLEPLDTALQAAQDGPRNLFLEFRQQTSGEDVLQKTARLAKKYFGYDRVLIYRFDEEWNGEVVAEAKEAEMQSWFGLHYPATDIPQQSRAMFLKNGMRMISDVEYTPVPLQPSLSPITGEHLDLTPSSLRAVSPIHIEYLKNMGVGASLTAAIEVRGKLWGLIACHHRNARYLDFYQRESCLFLSQMLAMELSIAETEIYREKTDQNDQRRAQLIEQTRAAEKVSQGLCEGPVKFTDLLPCGGGALYLNGEWSYLGSHPDPEDLEELLEDFVMKQEDTLFYTDKLVQLFPKAEKYRQLASGLLSLQLAENKFMLWFRPEVLQTVNWGGNPNRKATYNEKENRISPRKSFEKWTELKEGTSLPWKNYNLAAVKALGEAVSYELLARQRNEIERLYADLTEANKELEMFSYGLSHDLKAPVRGIEGLLDIVLEEHAEHLDPQGIDYLERAMKLSRKLELLINAILTYSQMSHSSNLEFQELDTRELLEEVFDLISAKAQYPKAQIRVQEDLPKLWGDKNMLVQVWTNLLTNALKYSREQAQPEVEIGSGLKDGRQVFFIKDNGIGLPEKFRESIFEPFTRAVGSKFEGTGIGLALVRKLIEKHEGAIWAESELGEGSIFYLYLPTKEEIV